MTDAPQRPADADAPAARSERNAAAGRAAGSPDQEPTADLLSIGLLVFFVSLLVVVGALLVIPIAFG